VVICVTKSPNFQKTYFSSEETKLKRSFYLKRSLVSFLKRKISSKKIRQRGHFFQLDQEKNICVFEDFLDFFSLINQSKAKDCV